MRAASEWDEDYILSIPTGEHDWVEFKDARKLDLNLPTVKADDIRNELSKQISAFANTGDGTIVYGVADAPAGDKRVVDPNGGVSLSIKGGTKEWLEDIIPQLVDLPLTRFNVYLIVSNGSLSGIMPDKGLILIEILEGENAPHQANDHKYYARVGGKSRPIQHRLVLDFMGRAKHPKMKITCEIIPKGRYDGAKNRDVPILRFYCRNQGRVFANYVNGFIYVPASLASVRGEEDAFEDTIDDIKYVRKYFDNTIQELVGQVKRHYGGQFPGTYNEPTFISRFNPVLPARRCTTSVGLHIPLDQLADHTDEKIFWEVYADSAPIERGSIKVAELIEQPVA